MRGDYHNGQTYHQQPQGGYGHNGYANNGSFGGGGGVHYGGGQQQGGHPAQQGGGVGSPVNYGGHQQQHPGGYEGGNGPWYPPQRGAQGGPTHGPPHGRGYEEGPNGHYGTSPQQQRNPYAQRMPPGMQRNQPNTPTHPGHGGYGVPPHAAGHQQNPHGGHYPAYSSSPYQTHMNSPNQQRSPLQQGSQQHMPPNMHAAAKLSPLASPSHPGSLSPASQNLSFSGFPPNPIHPWAGGTGTNSANHSPQHPSPMQPPHQPPPIAAPQSKAIAIVDPKSGKALDLSKETLQPSSAAAAGNPAAAPATTTSAAPQARPATTAADAAAGGGGGGGGSFSSLPPGPHSGSNTAAILSGQMGPRRLQPVVAQAPAAPQQAEAEPAAASDRKFAEAAGRPSASHAIPPARTKSAPQPRHIHQASAGKDSPFDASPQPPSQTPAQATEAASPSVEVPHPHQPGLGNEYMAAANHIPPPTTSFNDPYNPQYPAYPQQQQHHHSHHQPEQQQQQQQQVYHPAGQKQVGPGQAPHIAASAAGSEPSGPPGGVRAAGPPVVQENCPNLAPHSRLRAEPTAGKSVLESAALKLKEVSPGIPTPAGTPSKAPHASPAAEQSPPVASRDTQPAVSPPATPPPQPLQAAEPQPADQDAGASIPSPPAAPVPQEPPADLATSTLTNIKRYTLADLFSLASVARPPSAESVDRWTRLELFERQTSKGDAFAKKSALAGAPVFFVPQKGTPLTPAAGSPSFTHSLSGSGYFSDFSRDMMRTVDRSIIRSPLDSLIGKADNRFIASAPTGREEAAEKKIQGVLNKLTPQKYENNLMRMKNVIFEEFPDMDLFARIVDHVFEKAIAEPNFSDLYAELCKDLSELSHEHDNGRIPLSPVTPTNSTPTQKLKSKFRRALLNRCQQEFEKELAADAAFLSTPEGHKMRIRSVSAMKFIGELFIRDLIVEKIIHSCIQQLLGVHAAGQPPRTPKDEEIEMLCKLMFTIGKQIDHEKAVDHMNRYFERIGEISGMPTTSVRLRFLLQEVTELRQRGWVLRKAQALASIRARKMRDGESQFYN
ncbi:Eukaryotic translation initiation factor 4G [Diplonema papillatum]|nr:Eukaryotic translation initiation factor 4G [Diplonema papillatum]